MRSKKLIKKGGAVKNILIQEDIEIKPRTNLYKEITKYIESGDESTKEMYSFLNDLNSITDDSDYRKDSGETIFMDIKEIIMEYDKVNKKHFQSAKFPHRKGGQNNTLFGKYELFTQESNKKYITIDPEIIQILIFDANDIVYSLKLIIRKQNNLLLRYTTMLFPTTEEISSEITTFSNLQKFITFNKNLNQTFFSNFDSELKEFMLTYIKFYNFYKKCYIIGTKNLYDYQLKYISILGKARFKNTDIINRTALVTDYIMSNLLFVSPAYGFISGGYKGFKDNAYGITRSGYEIAKKYNRPILTIMCKEGMHDAHEYSDATLIYGEHWGEDTIALSQLTDGAIIIAPFGGWTYVECLALLKQQKIVGIYNDLYNILNYEYHKTPEQVIETVSKSYDGLLDGIGSNDMKTLINEMKVKEINELTNINKNKYANINFFKFFPSEQNSIINYYINYYLILLHILNEANSIVDEDEFKSCLKYGIKILAHLKKLFTAGEVCLINESGPYFSDFRTLLTAFNSIKTNINNYFTKNYQNINAAYKTIINPKNSKESDKLYQDNIPEKCDGIWIKPSFDLIDNCVTMNPSGEKNANSILETGRIYASFGKATEAQKEADKNLIKATKELEAAVKAASELEDKTNEVTKAKDAAKAAAEAAAEAAAKAAAKISGGRKSRRKGGNCRSNIEQPLLDQIDNYIIEDANIKKDLIFTNLNNNIIFVFSDVMYLNKYLNTNLNKKSFQENMVVKIDKLTKTYITGRTNISMKNLLEPSFTKLNEEKNKSYRDLLKDMYDFTSESNEQSRAKIDEKINSVNLNRNIDGMYDIEKGIINHHLIREKYSFIIDNTCTEYSLVANTSEGTKPEETKPEETEPRGTTNIVFLGNTKKH
jgi:hypothetical protein